jgi:apolipoprotein D and lipocalin family protein
MIQGIIEMTEGNINDLRTRLKQSSLSFLLLAILPFSSATAMPDGAKAVTGFSLERYLGTWYEIARLDHFFERGMTQVTATYSMRDDGGVKVLNRGYKEKKSKWKEAEGKAYFVDEADVGRLKVSFFGPFYGAYNIITLEPENYSYALVIGNNKKYMWILAREPNLDSEVLDSLLNEAQKLGFDTEKLIFPQNQLPASSN